MSAPPGVPAPAGPPAAERSAAGPEDLTARVYQRIREQILDGALRPGQAVTISALAAALDCSTTPVREALAMLAGGGLVRREQHRGFRIAELPDRRGVEALYDFRFLLEPWAAGRAAARMSPTGVRRLRREIEAFAAVGDRPTAREIATHDESFHRLLLEYADNPQAAGAYDRCQVHLTLFRLGRFTADTRATLAEHRAVAEAVADGDPARARTAMTDHLAGSLERMLPRAAG